MPRDFRFHDARLGAAITVLVFQDAAEDRVSRILKDGTIKIHLKSPKAGVDINQSLISFLAGLLNVPTGKIEVVAGIDGTEKIVSITDLDSETVNQRITNRITG